MAISKSLTKALALLLLGMMMSLNGIAGDDVKGHLTGTVVDPNGEQLPGVTVNAENDATGVRRSGVTTGDGTFRFPGLAVGKYTVTASMTGFQTYKATVAVGLGGKTTISVVMTAGEVSEVMTVTSAALLVDTTSTTSGLTVKTDELMERIPVARDQNSVSLLAPGSLEGDTAFNASHTENRQLTSIGGASVAENAYLVNGLNTTNFRNGLGGSNVPFEFLDELQVKTGGYQAEFGRSTGGVINSVTKSGGNEFKYGVSFFWEPDSLAEQSPDTDFSVNSVEEYDVKDANIYVSGPIVKDKAFFYALYNPRKRDTSAAGRPDGGTLSDYESDDAWWGAKLDWHITPEHQFEITAWTDESSTPETTVRQNDAGQFSVVDPNLTDNSRGGENIIAKYTGILTPNLTVSAQYGTNKFDRTSASPLDATAPAIYDSRDGGLTPMGTWVNFAPEFAEDERTAYRLDVDYFLGNHSIRAGLDFETNESFQQQQYSGGIYWRYYTAGDGNRFDLPTGQEYVRERIFRNGGTFETDTSSIYIQDSWDINENFTLNVGLRNTTFDNRNANDESFIKVDNQIAPRLGLIWDPSGDGNTKIYLNYGRYYLPIPSNTNIRMSGAEFFTEDYYVATSINEGEGTHVKGDFLDGSVYGDGEVPDPAEILDTSTDPMFQEEFVIGYDTKIGDDWSIGIRGVARRLTQTIEDVAVDAALNRYVEATTGEVGFAHGFDYYVLTNPGTDLSFSVDIDHDGVLDPVTLSASELGYPEAERNYYAVEFTFNKRWKDNWMFQGSYTWSHSYGNYEGWVRSDNGQDDAGITTLFDQPGLLDGAYGNLPNDRRHNLKLFGAYGFDNGLTLGGNVRYLSGRPINSIGVHPTDVFAAEYGAESFYTNGVLQPRGSHGTTDNMTKFDLSAQYPISIGSGQLTLRADIFNALDADAVTEVYEWAETDAGDADPDYNKISQYQTPRRVRFSAAIRF